MLNAALEMAIAANEREMGACSDLVSTPYLDQHGKGNADPLRPLHTVQMSSVAEEKVRWLWEPFLPLGTFCLAEGAEGIGKTFVACSLTCAIANGGGLPGVLAHNHIPASNVILISAEDSVPAVLKPRLKAMGAPMERIFAIDEPFTLDDEGILRLEMVLAKYKPKLVVIDPLFSYTGRINLNNDNEIRSVTDKLKRLAETYECTILGIRHIGKSKGFGDVRNAGLNGVGWRASARSCLLIGQNPDNDRERAICQTKSNYGPKYEGAIGFEIIDGQLRWTGPSTLTADMMLCFTRSESTEERGERHDAMVFLRETLGAGRISAKEIQTAARSVGLSDATLRRAKTALGVKSTKDTSANGVWFWELPKSQGAHEDSQILSIEHLQLEKADKARFYNGFAEGAHHNRSEQVPAHLQMKDRCPECGDGTLKVFLGGLTGCELCGYEVRELAAEGNGFDGT